MQLYILRIVSVVAIALVYMLFDVLNKRNVPSLFAYATLAYGILLTILYLDATTILVSTGIALVVLGVGYLIYRIGQLGAADVIEFAALSLIMPIQLTPLIASGVNQFQLPFMLSLLLNTGIVALILVPIYYLPKAMQSLKKPLTSFIDRQGLIKARHTYGSLSCVHSLRGKVHGDGSCRHSRSSAFADMLMCGNAVLNSDNRDDDKVRIAKRV